MVALYAIDSIDVRMLMRGIFDELSLNKYAYVCKMAAGIDSPTLPWKEATNALVVRK